MVDHVLPQTLPRDEDGELIGEVLEEDAEGKASTIGPLLPDEVFHLWENITNLALPSRESEELLWVLQEIILVLANGRRDDSHDDGDVFLGRVELLSSL